MTFIRVPADSVGKQVETNTPNTDHRQVVTVGDSSAVNTMAVASTGQANVLAQLTDGVHPLSTLFDADTGAGVQWLQGVVLRKSASGGSVEAGTVSDPLRIDPTGTTLQPISGTVTANAGTGPFPISDNAGSITVDGVFFQATQPVSGTFWQATQPVSGTFFQATQPVSGTFWQATQPVSIASMPSTPVTGTFWQTTQPISGTVTATDTATVSDSAPAYIDGTMQPLSMTQDGRLRVVTVNESYNLASWGDPEEFDSYTNFGATSAW